MRRTADSKSANGGLIPSTPAIIGASPSGKATDSDSVIRWFESISPCHSRLLTNRPQLVYNFPVTDIHLNLALAGTLSRLFTTSLPAIPICTQKHCFGYTSFLD